MDVAVGGIITGRIEKTVDKIKVMVAFEVASDEVEIRLNSENEAFGCLIRFLVIPFTIMRSTSQTKALFRMNSPMEIILLQKLEASSLYVLWIGIQEDLWFKGKNEK